MHSGNGEGKDLITVLPGTANRFADSSRFDPTKDAQQLGRFNRCNWTPAKERENITL